MLEITWAGESLGLHQERALWWPRNRSLLVADTHFGKEEVFHASGIPVPVGNTARDLDRLTALIAETRAERLLILGDFFHGAASQSERIHSALIDWRARHSSLEVFVVRGNHDRHAGDPPGELGLHVVDPPMIVDPFLLVHEANGSEAEPVIEGHVHPAVRLTDGDGSRLRAACFHLRPMRLTLPAFGGFTGRFDVTPRAGDRIVVAHAGTVTEVPLAAAPPPPRLKG